MKLVLLIPFSLSLMACANFNKSKSIETASNLSRRPSAARWMPVAELLIKEIKVESSELPDNEIQDCDFRVISFNDDGSIRLIVFPTSILLDGAKRGTKISFIHKRELAAGPKRVFGLDLVIKDKKVVSVEMDEGSGFSPYMPRAQLQKACD